MMIKITRRSKVIYRFDDVHAAAIVIKHTRATYCEKKNLTFQNSNMETANQAILFVEIPGYEARQTAKIIFRLFFSL